MDDGNNNTTNPNITEYIGYAEFSGFYYILIVSFLSVLINIIFIGYFLFKFHFNKQVRKVSSLEQMFVALSILEAIISSLWFYSEIVFPNSDKLIDEDEKDGICLHCKILGTIQTFAYIFYCALLCFTSYHLNNMILNPINNILKSGKKIFLYIFISGIIGFIGALSSYFLDVVGKSPMVTCFLTLDNIGNDYKYFNEVFLGVLIILPIVNFLFYLTQYIILIRNPSYKNDKENRRIFNDHRVYFILNILMTVLIVSLYILYFFYKDRGVIKGTFLRWYFFIVTYFICLNPLIAGIVKLKKAGIFRLLKNSCDNKKARIESSVSIINEDNDNELMIEKFETSAITKFVMNVYISVCYCIEKSIHSFKHDYNLNQHICNESNVYTISKNEIYSNTEMESLQNDVLVKSRENFVISCVEYAPKVFNHLRQIDQIDEKDIVQSLLPMFNKSGINETEGRGGSFFINSDDSEFCIKTITYNEMELFREFLLFKMANYFDQNKDSLIGRVYGLYKISIRTGIFHEDEIYFILMKNVIGSFYDNLICKYDLKGSSLDRKVNLGEHADNVMKDTNFNEIEQVLLLEPELSKKLLANATKDANLFGDLKIMDYSLLVAKVSLNNQEIEQLFGKNHRTNQEKVYVKMAGTLLKTRTRVDDDNEVQGNNVRFKIGRIDPLRKYFYPSLKGDVLYIISIIDFFQLYNLQKNLETKFKSFKVKSKKEISSMPPEEYKERFIEFVRSITESEKYLKEINNPENKNDF